MANHSVLSGDIVIKRASLRLGGVLDRRTSSDYLDRRTEEHKGADALLMFFSLTGEQ